MKKDQVVKYLVENESFRDWVKEGGGGEYWQNWLDQNQEFQEEYEVARDIILGISFRKEEVPADQVESARARFWAVVDTETGKPASRPAMIPIYRRWLSRVAAVALVLVSAWIVFHYTVDRGDGEPVPAVMVIDEVREIELPDSTVVTLNANSSISYDQEEWKDVRKVFLEGEAFFDVKKVNTEGSAKKFEVRTRDLIVSVLGTAFNVDVGPMGTTVVLEEGSIQLEIEGMEQPILMEVGDKVVYSRERGLIEEDLVRAGNYSSWKEGVLTLEGKDLGEVVQWIERRYEVEIGIGDQISDIPLSGSVNISQLDDAIRAISLAAGVTAEKINDQKWQLE